MKEGFIKLMLRLLWVAVSGMVLLSLVSSVFRHINSISHYLTDGSFDLWMAFRNVEFIVFAGVVLGVMLHLALEIKYFYIPTPIKSRLLIHLRFGPIAVSLISGMVLVLFDLGMIAYSKHEIRSYVYGQGTSLQPPDIALHNNYRGWCGNGVTAHEKYLYFETAVAGVSDDDPYIRSRSLLMANEVRDWLNGGDRRFNDYVLAACNDDDPIVYGSVQGLLRRTGSSCIARLSKAK